MSSKTPLVRRPRATGRPEHPDTASHGAPLEDAPDAEFQTMWLAMMVEHHEGAVEMAKSETEDGQ